jgi:hypothetical protein
MSCSDQGFGLRVTAKLCADVEKECQKDFVTAGYPDLACFHSFYVANAAKWVDAFGTPTEPPAADLDQAINGQAAGSAPAGVPAPPIDTSTGGGVPIGPVAPAPPFPVSTGQTGVSTDNNTGVATGQATAFSTAFSTGQASTGATGVTSGQQSSTDSSSGPTGGTDGVSQDTGLSGGAIAGIVIGVLVAVAIIAALVWYFVIRGGSEGAYKNFDQT